MLHIVSTPLGNLKDLCPRGQEALKNASLIACEDTRRTWQLLSAFNIPRPEMISYRQGNEDRVAERILEAVRAGREVAVCSDGGYPGISDPGYRLVREASQANIPYDVTPGPCAVDLALLYSGLSTASYTFKGFPPRKPGALRHFFEDEREMPHTLIVYESPFRIAATLAAAAEVLGSREAAVCIELTKVHERVQRGYLPDLAKAFAGQTVKGEIALVIAGNNPKFARSEEEAPEA